MIWFDPGALFKAAAPAPQAQQVSDPYAAANASRDAANTAALKEKQDAINRSGARQSLITDASAGTTFGSTSTARKSLLGANV